MSTYGEDEEGYNKYFIRSHGHPSSNSGNPVKGILKCPTDESKVMMPQATQTVRWSSELSVYFNPDSNSVDGCNRLLDLPSVAYNKIIAYLPPKTCLALRRVCLTTHSWITETLIDAKQITKWRKYRLKITGQGVQTFVTVVNMNLPITEFCLHNSRIGESIYTSEGHQQFLEVYGPITTFIYVERHSLFEAETEYTFFLHFHCLRFLQIFMATTFIPTGKQRTPYEIPPNIASSLTILIFSGIEESNGRQARKACQENIIKLIDSSKNLVHLRPPSWQRKYRGAACRIGCIVTYFGLYITYCHKWMQRLETSINAWLHRSTYAGNCCLLDMENFCQNYFYKHLHPQFCTSYGTLLQLGIELDVWFRNVHADELTWVYLRRRIDGWPFGEIADSFRFMNNIVSLVGTCSVLGYSFSSMINLKEIRIKFDGSLLLEQPYELQALEWKSLEKIDLTLVLRSKSTLSEDCVKQWNTTTSLLFSRERKNVKWLSLKLKADSKLLRNVAVDQCLYNAIDVDDVVLSFKWVTNLSISGWNLPNKAFLKLWTSLTKLECLSIDSCRKLGDYGFIGKKKRNQEFCAFSKLSGLRKLVLKGLDEMKVTEKLFISVISCMCLDELTIVGSAPQVTNQALKTLRQGKFGSSIVKFPLHTWVSKNISETDKVEIKNWFPSGV
ncbi:unnamed protein product [Orchesella dallaii]|uniref:F-box domain-containing protein n=1 Tax=Orchesella dallaii TaxID=48710 RepID=A0ABP1QHK9_9HEXA